jgi:hypothetical protein
MPNLRKVPIDRQHGEDCPNGSAGEVSMFNVRRIVRISLWAMAFSLVSVLVCSAQSASVPVPHATEGLYHTPAQISSVLVRPFLALGDRLMKPGNERITLVGTLTDGAGSSGVRIVMELGGKLNITWTGSAAAQKAVFDGKNSSVVGNLARSSDVLEAFVDDLAETALISVAGGTGVRLLGQRFADSSGGYCDYFDIPTRGVAEEKPRPVTKRYCFDSKTSLLRSVRYFGSQNQQQLTVTEFANWTTVNGQAVPGTVTRLQGTTQVFQFQARNAVVSPAIADSTFVP